MTLAHASLKLYWTTKQWVMRPLSVCCPRYLVTTVCHNCSGTLKDLMRTSPTCKNSHCDGRSRNVHEKFEKLRSVDSPSILYSIHWTFVTSWSSFTLLCLLTLILQLLMYTRYVEVKHKLGESNGCSLVSLHSTMQVKNFGNEPMESRKLSTAIDKYLKAEFTMLMSFNVISLLQGTIVFAATLLGLVLCVKVSSSRLMSAWLRKSRACHPFWTSHCHTGKMTIWSCSLTGFAQRWDFVFRSRCCCLVVCSTQFLVVLPKLTLCSRKCRNARLFAEQDFWLKVCTRRTDFCRQFWPLSEMSFKAS